MTSESTKASKHSSTPDLVLNTLRYELQRYTAEKGHALITRRLVLSSLYIGTLTLLLQWEANAQDRLFGVHWIGVALLQFLLLALFLQSRTRKLRNFAAVTASLSVFGFWAIWVLHNGSHSAISLLLLLISYVAIGNLPWSNRFNLCLAIFFVVLCTSAQLGGASGVGILLSILFIAPLVLRQAARARVSLLSYSFSHFLNSFSSDLPDAPNLLRVFAWWLSKIAAPHNALLLLKPDWSEIAGAQGVLQTSIPGTYQRGLSKLVEQGQTNIGVLSRQLLGAQYYALLEDLFGHVPSHLLYVSAHSILDDEERRVDMLVPAGTTAPLCGTVFLLNELGEVRAQLQSALAAQRSRFISSGMLSATQRSISEQELELNEIIHFANNTAQDVAILCEGLQQLLSNMAQGSALHDQTEPIKHAVQKLESAVSFLSREVSDIKLLRELIKMRSTEFRETLRVATLAQDLHLYCGHRAQRKSENIEVLNRAPAEAALQVQSVEYLQTILRLLVREAVSRIGREGKVRAIFSSEAARLNICIEDDGSPTPFATIEQRSPSLLAGDPQYFAAAQKFFELNKGDLQRSTAEPPFSTRVVGRLPLAAVSEPEKRLPGQWVLLVDDKVEVTSFYGRIADALGLRHLAAAALDEALRLIELNGRPRMVLTDLNLGEQSGWTLIEEVRKRFGKDLPVIVVSGETDHNRANELDIEELGRLKLLTKPVGRGKLFNEIQEILSR